MSASTSQPISRRSFLKLGASVAGGAVVTELNALGIDARHLRANALRVPMKTGQEVPSVCPYCAVGCGQIVMVDPGAGKIIDIQEFS